MKRRIEKTTGRLATIVAAAMVVVGCGGSDGGSSNSTIDGTATTVGDAPGSEPTTTGPDDGLPDFGYEGGNFIKVFEDNDLFSKFLEAVTAAGLTDLLEGVQPLTIFVPANKAFDELPDGVLEKLLKPENRDVLRRVLNHHIVEGNYFAPNIATGELTTLEGSTISVEAFATQDFTKLLKVDGKYAVIPNMEATNGTIHVINWVMLPPGLDLGSL